MKRKGKMVTRRAFSLGVLMIAAPAFAQDNEEGHSEDRTVQLYFSRSFLSAFFVRGTGAVWSLCLPLYVTCVVLLAYLIKRKGWQR